MVAILASDAILEGPLKFWTEIELIPDIFLLNSRVNNNKYFHVEMEHQPTNKRMRKAS